MDLEKGDEILIRYGDYSDLELFEYYGFVGNTDSLRSRQHTDLKIAKDHIISSCEKAGIYCEKVLKDLKSKEFRISIKGKGQNSRIFRFFKYHIKFIKRISILLTLLKENKLILDESIRSFFNFLNYDIKKKLEILIGAVEIKQGFKKLVQFELFSSDSFRLKSDFLI